MLYRQRKKNVGTFSDTITNLMESVRDFASFTLPGDVPRNVKNVVGITKDDSSVIVVTYTGVYLKYSINKNGGECSLQSVEPFFKPPNYDK